MAYPTTFAEAILDPSVPIHWVLTLEKGGDTWRFADTDLTISDRHYVGALAVSGKPSQSIDPWTQRASACTATVQLHPVPDEPGDADTTRPYDLAKMTGFAFIGMQAKLGLWAEGTADTEIKVRLSGYASRPSIDENGVLTLHLEDWSTRRNRHFPQYRVELEDHPYARGDDRAKGYSILYNKAVGLPCPCSTEAALSGGASSFFLIAFGATSANTAVYKDDEAWTAYCTFLTGTSVQGKEVTWFYVSSAYPAEGATYTFWGLGPVDASGYYQGTAGALLSNPIAQLWHMAVHHGGIPHELIDEGEFARLREVYTAWASNIQIGPDDETTYFDVVEEMSGPMWCAFFVWGDRLTARMLDLKAASVLHLRENENLFGLTVNPDDESNLRTKLTVKYNWGWSFVDEELSFRESKRLDPDTSTYLANIESLLDDNGEIAIEEVVETKYFSEAATMDHHLAMSEQMHGVVRATGTAVAEREAHDLKIYDAVQITHSRYPSSGGSGCAAKRVIVTGLTWDRDRVEIEWLEA